MADQDYQRLKKYRSLWRRKKVLRLIYQEWYEQISRDLKPGKTLEIGSGIGSFKAFNSQIISSDIVACEWLDYCFDAHRIPFPNNWLKNIVMIDVLHHLSQPLKFFDEAYRVLKKGGRIILMEPFPSPVSWLVYKLFHPEPFIFDADLFNQPKRPGRKQPWESNQAIPYLLFFKHQDKFDRLFKGKFKLVKKEKFSFLTYPLSGGFENRQLIPDFAFPLAACLEKSLYPLRDLLAFRCYLILQKK